MVYSYKTSLLPAALLVAVAHARFGQENSVQSKIGAVTTGNPGQAATLAGASIGTLLAGANPCLKLTTADQVAALGGTQAIAAAQALVQAEKNFNPFTASGPTVCSDPTLPTTAALRGIIELVDPSVAGADAVNSASADSLTNPVDATGKSQADLFTAIGFTGFTAQAADGTAAAAAASGGAAAASAASGNAAASSAASVNVAAASAVVGAAGAASANACAAAATTTATASTVAVASAAASSAAAGTGTGATTATTASTGATAANLQTFTGALGGAAADPITNSGDAKRPFEVNGDTFVNFAAAAQRTCDVQFNACANQANSGAAFSVSDCTTQKTACNTAQTSTTATSFTKRNLALARYERLNNRATTATAASNLQTFTGTLGAAADPITNSGDAKRPFEVNGDTLVNFAAAAQRSCDVQFNACANQANAGSAAFSVADCNTQKTACDAAQTSTSVKSFARRSMDRLAKLARREFLIRSEVES